MSRQEQISNLQSYLKEVDKDLTMILQNLQWDRSLLSTEQASLSKCKYNDDHKISNSKLREHEEMCFLKQNGYSSEDVFLPELLDTDGPTVVKFNSNAIKDIIDNAAKKNPLFKRGCNSELTPTPLTTERLQSTYTADERRAIHDAVVSSMRTQSENIDDFVIPSGGSGAADSDKSWLERLAEKRDGRRRRTKYRAPPKTRNYSLVLRDVISTQMELLNEMSGNTEADQSNTQEEDGVDIKKETDESTQYESTSNTKRDVNAHKSRHYEKYSHDNKRRHNRHEDTESRRYYDKYGKDKYHEDTEYKRYYERHIKDKNNEYAEYRENNDNHSKDKYNEDAESKRYYDNYKQEPRNYKKSGEKISKDDTNVEDSNSYYSRHTEYSRRERGRSTRESSKDKSKYKKYRDDKRYDSKDESTKYDKRKRQCDDEKYEGYTEREEYNSSNRKREKYDERQEREKDRRYGKSKSDYTHKKDY